MSKSLSALRHFLTFAALLCCIAGTCFAPVLYAQEPTQPLEQNQEPAQTASPNPGNAGPFDVFNIKLIQSYPSKHFGNLTLPAFWIVEESAERAECHVTEGQEAQPRVISLVLLDKLPELPSDTVYKAVAAALGKRLQDSHIQQEELRAADENILSDRYFVHVQGTEEGVLRDCFVLLIHTKVRLFSVSLCTPSSRPMQESVAPLLEAILAGMSE